MKNALRIAMLSLALTAVGCGGDDGGSATPADAGRKDGGAKVDGGPSCDTVMCGTTCCQAGETCDTVTDTCVTPCNSDCTGKTCGQSDGCGGHCTSCPTGQTCSTTTWTCQACTPSCSDRSCGEGDSCGGKCTTCPAGQTCNTNTWSCATTCTPSCTGKTCGQPDGCGGKCTTCPTGQSCNQTSWKCEGGCTPNCNGATCGAVDGCGGKCVGTCPTGQTCDPTTFVCGTAPACSVVQNFGTLPNITSGGEQYGTDYLGLWASINADAAPDYLSLELYPVGRFATGFQTGTFQLTGDDLQYETCAACVLIRSDVDEANQTVGPTYMATGGTLTLTSVNGRLTGSLTGVGFQEVTIGAGPAYHSTPVPNGCTSSITSASFDSTITDL